MIDYVQAIKDDFNPYAWVIGQQVRVFAKVEAGYNESNNRVLFREEIEETFGEVVGLKRLQTGKYNRGGPMTEWGDVESPYLDGVKMVPVWLVRFGMFNRPIQVLQQDLKAGITLEEFPIRYSKRKLEMCGAWDLVNPSIQCRREKGHEGDHES